jgi:uncharacterized C2H2 Zn-finger protein
MTDVLTADGVVLGFVDGGLPGRCPICRLIFRGELEDHLAVHRAHLGVTTHGLRQKIERLRRDGEPY